MKFAAAASGQRAEVLKKLHAKIFARAPTRNRRAPRLVAQRSADPFGLCSRIRKRMTVTRSKAAQRHVADGGGDLAGEIEFARLAESHRLAGIEKDADRQFAFLFVEFEEKPFEPAIEIPIEIAEIVAVRRSCDNRRTRPIARAPAAALALGGTLGAARGEQLELLQAAQEFGSEERAQS